MTFGLVPAASKVTDETMAGIKLLEKSPVDFGPMAETSFL